MEQKITYEVKPIMVPDMDRAIRAYYMMAKVSDSEIGLFIKEMISCSLRKEGSDRPLTRTELYEISALESLEYVDKVMEVNADFFERFVEKVPPAIDKIHTSK